MTHNFKRTEPAASSAFLLSPKQSLLMGFVEASAQRLTETTIHLFNVFLSAAYFIVHIISYITICLSTAVNA